MFQSSFDGSATPSGSFTGPAGMAVDQATGDVYVFDTGHNVVDKFDSSGHFLLQLNGTFQVWGGASASNDVAVDNSGDASTGDVYVTEAIANTVAKFSSSGQLLSTFTAPFPSGLAVDSSGNVWVSDLNDGVVHEYDSSGNLISTLPDPNCEVCDGPQGLAFDAQNDLYVSVGANDGDVIKFDSAGNFVSDFDPHQSGQGLPDSIAVDPSTGDVFSAHTNLSGGVSFVKQFDSSGTVIQQFGGTHLGNAQGIAVDDSTGQVYVADQGNENVQIFQPEPPVPPSVGSESAASVTSTSAVVKAQVNDNNFQTSYHAEFGTADCAATTCASVPAGTGIDLGQPTGTAQAASVQLTGLQPGTTYHYRLVAVSQGGTTDGPDQTFTTATSSQPQSCPNAQLRAENGSTSLPDCRAYELVSPVDKNGLDIDGGLGFSIPTPQQASLDGNSVTYAAEATFANSPSADFSVQYLSKRTAQGWVTQAIDPPLTPEGGEINPGGPWAALYQGFSPDLSHAFLGTGDPAPVAGAPAGFDNPYLRDDTTGGYQLLSDVTPPNRSTGAVDGDTNMFYTIYAGMSADYSHVIFEANDALTPGAPDPSEGGQLNPSTSFDLYDSVGGTLHLVSVLPDGTPAPQATFGAGGTEGFQNVISADGSKIFWTAAGNLYVRENDATTVQIPGGHFDFASADGSTVIVDDGSTLSSYDVATGQLTALTPSGSGIQGILGASEDASYVYFVADAVLAPGATTGDCENAGGSCNLYLWHAGTTTFIASLQGQTSSAGCTTNADSSDWSRCLSSRTAEVTPDGRHVVFQSEASLTGYDNTTSDGSNCQFTGAELPIGDPRCDEVFIYDAASNHLACASCDPRGIAPTGPSVVPKSGQRGPSFAGVLGRQWQTDTDQQRYVSDDGTRVFFNSVDALVPQDTNGDGAGTNTLEGCPTTSDATATNQQPTSYPSCDDVYEWEAQGAGSCQTAGGCISLISSGTGNNALFLDASANGNDVFFTTRNALVPEDGDGLLDVYDARVDGGFPYSPPADCSGDACRPPLIAAPPAPVAATVTFTGPGNLTARARKTKTGKVKLRHATVHGSAIKVAVTVPAEGRITAEAAGVKSVTRTVRRAGSYMLTARMKPALMVKLRHQKKLRVSLRVGYRPDTGPASTAVVALTVKA